MTSLYYTAIRAERERLVRGALTQAEGNVERAARILGIQRTYFYALMKRLGVEKLNK